MMVRLRPVLQSLEKTPHSEIELALQRAKEVT
jgi:hypothetical protein